MMRNCMKRNWLYLFSLLVFLSGCFVEVPANSKFTAEPSPPTVPTRPVQTSQSKWTEPPRVPTSIPLILTLTDTPSPKPSVIPSLESIPMCGGGGNPVSLNSANGISGTILFQDSSGLRTMGETPLKYGQLPIDPTKNYFVFGLSPDNKWLAYAPYVPHTRDGFNFEYSNVVLFSALGERREVTIDVSAFENELAPGSTIGFTKSNWINSELIYTTLVSSPPSGVNLLTAGYWPKIFDAFSGVSRDDFLDLPDRLPFASFNSIIPYGISPDEKLVLYERLINEKTGIALWNIEKQKILWSSDIELGGFSQFRWTTNSLMVAYSSGLADPANHQVFTLSSDSQKNTLIFDVTLGTVIQEMQWSPDNRYLAMVGFEFPEEKGYRYVLFLYDSQTKQYQFRCPLFSNETESLPNLVWSPDSLFIAYTKQRKGIQLLDVNTGAILDTGIDGKVVGWSDQFPVNLP